MTCGQCITVTVKLQRRRIYIYITCRCMCILPRLIAGWNCEVFRYGVRVLDVGKSVCPECIAYVQCHNMESCEESKINILQ